MAFDRVSLVIGLFVGIWSAVVSLVAFIIPKCIDCCLGIQMASDGTKNKVKKCAAQWAVLHMGRHYVFQLDRENGPKSIITAT